MTTKEKILTLLQKEDTVLSGEKLAQALSISRTAVWKAIKELEKEGYHFEHLANGYRFVSDDRRSSSTCSRLADDPHDSNQGCC